MKFLSLIYNRQNIICTKFQHYWYKIIEDIAVQILERFFWDTLYIPTLVKNIPVCIKVSKNLKKHEQIKSGILTRTIGEPPG